MSSLKKTYENQVIKKLILQYTYKSIMQVPKIEKIVLNMRVGEAVHDKKHLTSAEKSLMSISGQKPVICRARKSVSGFKIRKGFPIGCMVTLRKKNMWDFLEKLIMVVLPRIRDFRGLKTTSFDKDGNLSFGITEFIVFPEIDMDTIDKMRGFDISIVTSTKNIEESKELLSAIGIPFQKN